LSACPVVSVIELAACTVTLAPVDADWSLMPSSIDWKNGLSRPLITAATLAVPPEEPDAVSEEEPELQPARTTRAAAVTVAATPRCSAMRGISGGVLPNEVKHVSSRFRLIRCLAYDGCQAKDEGLTYSDYT
jgi:hypothetical protein